MTLKIWLPDERPISWNRFMRMHWTKRHDEVLRVQWAVYAALSKTLGPNPDDWPSYAGVPVECSIEVWFQGRRYDVSNISEKLYEDGLKGNIIPDDSPPHVVRWHKGPCHKADKRHPPGVLVEIEEAT